MTSPEGAVHGLERPPGKGLITVKKHQVEYIVSLSHYLILKIKILHSKLTVKSTNFMSLENFYDMQYM